LDFYTDQFPTAERTRRYQSAMCQYLGDFDASFRFEHQVPAERFAASLSTLELGELSGAAHRINSAHTVEAAPKSPRPAHPGLIDWYLLYDGDLSISTPHANARLKAGDMLLLDSSQGFRGTSSGVDLIVVTVPARLAHGTRAHIGTPIGGQAGFVACVRALLQTALVQQSQLSVEESVFIESSIVHAFGFVGGRASNGGLHGAAHGQLDELKQLALRALQAPDLRATSLARAAGISTRQLQRLFERSGTTFGDWIRDRRIERCHMDLMSPGKARRANIATIAFKWGFSDLRTFNRAFRHRYGMSPSAAMAGAGAHS
jgi:AraC-like DNA-binding protein